MKRIINLTPHNVNIYKNDEIFIRIAPEDVPARVSFKNVTVDDLDGIPVSKIVYSDIKGLWPQREDTIYIVSRMVADRCPDRQDLFVPNDFVKDEYGNTIGCRSLTKIW